MTSDPLSRLFEAERAVQPPPHALEHGVARLLGDLAQQVAPLPVATGSLKLGVSLVSKWLVVGFVVGVGGAGAASQIWTPEAVAVAAPQPPSSSMPLTARVKPAPAPAEAPAAPVDAPTEATRAVSVRPDPAAASAVPAPVAANSAATFDAELRLITAAKSELDKGRPQLAAAWLAEHAQRFPNGVFAPDRDAMRILARCQQRQDPAVAREFAERHPGSPMVERLLRACTPAEASPAPAAVDFPK